MFKIYWAIVEYLGSYNDIVGWSSEIVTIT